MKPSLPKEVIQKIKPIKMILMDVDGVLTQGGIIMGNHGEALKIFNIQDGLGITLARLAEIKVGIITGRESELVSRRARELKFDVIMQGFYHKLPAYLEVKQSYGLNDDEICYIGDDLLDIDILERVGLAICPANARPEIKNIVDFVTRENGGEGAVRKVIDTILTVQGRWDSVLQTCRWQGEDTLPASDYGN
jgi:3-deoxy-D-manno-octulosonate 8-phosphate phosphatase (KDO 8-P phosphatase)